MLSKLGEAFCQTQNYTLDVFYKKILINNIIAIRIFRPSSEKYKRFTSEGQYAIHTGENRKIGWLVKGQTCVPMANKHVTGWY